MIPSLTCGDDPGRSHQRSSNLQVLEKQNSELAKAKFSQIRTQTKEIRQSRKVVNSYYQNMMKMNTVDPRLWIEKIKNFHLGIKYWKMSPI